MLGRHGQEKQPDSRGRHSRLFFLQPPAEARVAFRVADKLHFIVGDDIKEAAQLLFIRRGARIAADRGFRVPPVSAAAQIAAANQQYPDLLRQPVFRAQVVERRQQLSMR
ncbi:hypothetical protein SDC9_138038 [bioreactor metagenome]|uniref:Uncharacterized protein n=1 Tax=bioreactor metagenome TaxID=1076179 RepID=A0A645DNU4_9ZZZZ